MTLLDAIISILPLIQCLIFVFTITGYYFIGSRDAKKRAIGFELGVFGSIMWVIYAIVGDFSIIWVVAVTNIMIFAISLRGIWNNVDTIDPDLYHYMIKNGLLVNQNEKK